MEVKVDKMKGAEIITVFGKIDAYQSIKLKDALNEIIDKGSKKIIVNLHDVSFLDSTALGTLISALKKIKNKGGEICITRLQPNVEEIFELTHLNKIFKIFPSNEEAIDYLASLE